VDGLHVRALILNVVLATVTDTTRAFSSVGTTDAIFLEKPAYYDLIIDLTTSTPNKATRPTFYASRPIYQRTDRKGATHRLSVIRFAWSDVKLVAKCTHIPSLKIDLLYSGMNLTGFFAWTPEIMSSAAAVHRVILIPNQDRSLFGQMLGVSTRMFV